MTGASSMTRGYRSGVTTRFIVTRWDRVGDGGVRDGVGVAVAVHEDVADGETVSDLEESRLGDDVGGRRGTEEVDVEVDGDGHGDATDDGEDRDPHRGVGEGHEDGPADDPAGAEPVGGDDAADPGVAVGD